MEKLKAFLKQIKAIFITKDALGNEVLDFMVIVGFIVIMMVLYTIAFVLSFSPEP